MMASLLAAVLATAGMAMLYRLVVPSHPPLAADLARLLEPAPPSLARAMQDRGRMIVRLTNAAESRGLFNVRVRQELHIVDQSVDWLVVRSLGSALAFGLMAAVLGLALVLAGIALPLSGLALAVALGAGLGLLLPAYLLKAEAAEHRAALNLMLPGFLDLTGVLLAAGNSLEAALRGAAGTAGDWPHAQIQQALYAAGISRQPASEAMCDLGHRVGVDELSQLGDGLLMAEREGSSMRASLAARARGLRERHLADVETKAGSATEGMSFPLVAFVLGFVLLIGYPALVGLSTGLGS